MKTCSIADCDRPYRANGLCNGHHMRRKQASKLPDSAPFRMPDPTGAIRLATKVSVVDDCLLWSGTLNHSGYGHINVGGRFVGVHRLAYTLHVGPIPEDLEIDHLCFVRNCVNPEHLEAVTHEENLRRSRERQVAAA